MFLYEFYVNNMSWLSDLVCIGKYLPWGDGPMLESLPLQIFKLIMMLPFLCIVMWIPILFVIRVFSWMVGCWTGCAENIYED